MQGPDRAWLESGAVEVWVAPARTWRAAAALLNEMERQRAAGFHSEAARQRFTLGRGLARWALGALTGLPAAAVPLVTLPSGKPAHARPGARFNVAHSGALVLVALAWEREVGVDVEALRGRDELRIARRYFRPEEVAALAGAEGAARMELFARCWTRKEALLKAAGAPALLPGLAGLERPFSLECASERYAHAGRPWALGDVPLGEPGYAAAVAVEGEELRLRVRAWEE